MYRSGREEVDEGLGATEATEAVSSWRGGGLVRCCCRASRKPGRVEPRWSSPVAWRALLAASSLRQRAKIARTLPSGEGSGEWRCDSMSSSIEVGSRDASLRRVRRNGSCKDSLNAGKRPSGRRHAVSWSPSSRPHSLRLTFFIRQPFHNPSCCPCAILLRRRSLPRRRSHHERQRQTLSPRLRLE